METWLQS